jgi:hypothetical protein
MLHRTDRGVPAEGGLIPDQPKIDRVVLFNVSEPVSLSIYELIANCGSAGSCQGERSKRVCVGAQTVCLGLSKELAKRRHGIDMTCNMKCIARFAGDEVL